MHGTGKLKRIHASLTEVMTWKKHASKYGSIRRILGGGHARWIATQLGPFKMKTLFFYSLTSRIVDLCTFRTSFVAVKHQFPVEIADIYEAATKLETAMKWQRKFGKLPLA